GLGVTPLGVRRGLLEEVGHRLRQRGPHPFRFRPWSGRCSEVGWPQLTQDVGGGTHPWGNRIDGRHGGHPFGMVPFALSALGATWRSVGLSRLSGRRLPTGLGPWPPLAIDAENHYGTRLLDFLGRGP